MFCNHFENRRGRCLTLLQGGGGGNICQYLRHPGRPGNLEAGGIFRKILAILEFLIITKKTPK